MTQIIGFTIYRTENLSIDGVPYTIRFSVSKDGKEYILFVSNDQNGKQSKYNFSKETADDFQHYKGGKLETEVKKIIAEDMQKQII